METILIIALLVAVVALAVVGAALFMARRGNQSSGAVSEEAARIAAAQAKHYEEATSRLIEETRRQYERQIAILEQRLERQAEEVRQRSATEFSDLAAKALDAQSATLRRTNRNEIDAVLAPLRDRLADFQKAVRESYVDENARREALSEKIEYLTKMSSEVGEEARRLSNALRGNAALQGKWGETVLEQLLEKAGLQPGVHFSLQQAKEDGKGYTTEEGTGLRPDVVLLLPGKHKVIIDSKASVSAYLSYSEAETEMEAKIHLKRHALSVRKHIDELAAKQYHKNVPGALEQTLMFMPNDAAYLAALRADSALPDYAMSKNVAIVSPAHLMSVVQLVMQLWRVENQNRNAENIAKSAGQLYDKIVTFISDFESIEAHVVKAHEAYEKCLGQLAGGRGNVLGRVEKLREMGAKTSKRIPERLLAEVGDQEISEAGGA